MIFVATWNWFEGGLFKSFLNSEIILAIDDESFETKEDFCCAILKDDFAGIIPDIPWGFWFDLFDFEFNPRDDKTLFNSFEEFTNKCSKNSYWKTNNFSKQRFR